MTSKILVSGVFLLLLAVMLSSSFSQAHGETGEQTRLSTEGLGSIGGDFEFINEDGRLSSLKDLRNKAMLVFFGYTNCPDECPAFLAKTVAVHELLGEYKERFKVVFVSIDPERDGREALKKYLALFGDGIVGARIPGDNLLKVEGQYAVLAQKISDTSGNVVISHSTGAYLVAPTGVVTDYVPAGSSIDEIADMVIALLEG